ncbi:MAG: FHA domain-containing protein [Bdellovibrionales bacterium]|nr:FHA domain-containing protein [Bdellovibrionales bacterium]
MSAAAVLHILKNGETIKSHKVEGEVSLGRGEGCVIRLDDRAISRNHATIRPSATGLQVEKKSDFGSIMVNGADVTQATLKDGDVINMGPFLIRLQMEKEKEKAAEAQAVQMAAVAAPVAAVAAPPAPEPTALESGLVMPDPAVPTAAVEAVTQDTSSDAGIPAFQTPLASGNDSGASMGMPFEQLPQATPVSSDFAEGSDDGRTKLTPQANVKVRLLFPPGAANFQEFDITKDEISLGRGKNCDIVLEDKKASRKHVIIRRVGLSFTIKDLESANGTWVNGVQINEQELTGDDSIQIGDTLFQFKVFSGDYANQEAQGFESAEQDAGMGGFQGQQDFGQAAMVGGMDGFASNGQMTGQPVDAAFGGVETGSQIGISASGVPLITGIAPEASGKKPTMYEKYVKNFKNLNPRQKVLTLFVGLGLVYFVFLEEDEPENQARRPASVQLKGQLPTFDQLSLAQKQFVDSQYQLAWDHYQKQDFEKALYEIQKVFTMVKDYKNARELEQYSRDKKRLAERAEEDRRRQEKEAQIKAQVDQRVEELRGLMAAKHFEHAEVLFSQVLSLDPENQQVIQWKREIMAWQESKAIEEQRKKIEEQRNRQGNEYFAEVQSAVKGGDFHSALEMIDRILDLEVTDQKLLREVEKKEKYCIEQIDKRKRPALKAAQLAEKKKQFGKAYRFYREVSEIDPLGSEGPEGIERVRDALHERAKAIYAEGVLAENFSDLVTAKKKFEMILENTPEDDQYYTSAKRRLEKYGVLESALADVAPPPPATADGGISPADAAVPMQDESAREPAGQSGSMDGSAMMDPSDPAADPMLGNGIGNQSSAEGVPEPPDFSGGF